VVMSKGRAKGAEEQNVSIRLQLVSRRKHPVVPGTACRRETKRRKRDATGVYSWHAEHKNRHRTLLYVAGLGSRSIIIFSFDRYYTNRPSNVSQKSTGCFSRAARAMAALNAFAL
jgi:hypothetical protein